MRTTRPLARAALVWTAFTSLTVTALRADLGFIPLGIPSGATSSQATAISGDGSTVVGTAINASAYEEAFRWTAATGVVLLGDLPGGLSNSHATGVSQDGSVVVGNGSVASGFQEGFRWTQAGGLVAIGDIPGGVSLCGAAAVSSDGSIVVGYGYNAANRNEPLRWTSATGSVGLGFLMDGAASGNSGFAHGVSADGSVIVGSATLPTGPGYTHAYRHTTATGLVDLGVFSGGDQSVAYAASADGSVVVGSGSIAEFNREAFRWTAATGLVSLGDLPGGAVRSEALAVSADGSVIVGTAEGSALGDGAFVWDAVNGMRSIRALLTSAGLARGWYISAATGVSADGSKIVGSGSKDGVTQSWLIDFNAPPPEPPPAPTAALVWTEDRPQTVPLKGNSAVRLGYDNGVAVGDIATLTEASGGTWGGVEYANGLILVPSAATSGTGARVHDARYAPILVTNITAYDLDATPGYVWQVNGGSQQVLKTVPSPGFTGTEGGVLDRSYPTLKTRAASRFTNAVQTVGDTVYFSSSVGTTIGLFKTTADLLSAPVAVYTESGFGAVAIYDFEVVGDFIYFGDINNNAIKRVNTDGTGLVTLVSGASFPNGIDVTADAIYWTELNTKLIRRSALDGSGVATLYELDNTPRGVAVLPLSLVTGPAPQAITLTGVAPTYNGATNSPVALTATSTSGLPVTLSLVSGPATLDGSQLTYTGAGTVVVRATQAGDANHAAVTIDYAIAATPRTTQTVNFPVPSAVVYSGAPVALSLSATATSGLPVTFTVVSGPATRDTATGVISVTGVGSVVIRATQSGNASYAPAFAEQTLTVSGTPPSPPTTAQKITFVPPARATYGDSPIVLSATADSRLTVGFELVSGPATLSGANLTVTGAGKIVVKATQPGQGVYKPAAVSRTIIVAPASLTVTADDKSRLIGEANPAFTVRYSGFVNGDDEADLAPTRPIARSSAGTNSAQGQYAITVSGGADANYSYVRVAGKLTVLGFGGTYEALLFENDATPAGKLTLTVANNAYSYTGTLQLAREANLIKIKSDAPLLPREDAASASGNWGRSTDGVDALDLAITVSADGTLSGILDRNGEPFADLVHGARLLTVAKGQTAPGAGANTLTLFPAYNIFSDGPLPGGSGHATASIASATGVLTVKGSLADGALLTASIRPLARTETGPIYLLWANPYGSRLESFIAGALPLHAHPDQTRFAGRHYVPFDAGLFTWKKAALPTVPAPKTQDKSYRAGFGPLGVQVALDPWLPPSAKPTPTVPAGTLAQRLALSESGKLTVIQGPESLDLGARESLLPFEATLSSAGVFSASNASATAWTIKLAPATGGFTGSFQLSDQVAPAPAKPVVRTVTFSGTLRQAPSGESILGTGFFLVPGFAKTDEQPSGEIRFTLP